MRKSILIVVCVLMCACLQTTAGFAATQATITLQGRLTDVLTGDPVADGSHAGHIVISRTDNGQIVEAFPTIVTKDGYFSLDISALPLSLFECNEGATDCVQAVAISYDGQDPFPDIVMTNAGHAAVSSRVNGDIQTSPGQLEVPSATPFVDRKTIIKNDLFQMQDDNGDPAIEMNTEIGPGHPQRTCELNDVFTKFNGTTEVHSGFHVDCDLDNQDDFTCNVVDGVKIFEQPFSCDCDGNGLPEFAIDFTGNARFNCNGDGYSDWEMLNNGLCNLHNNGLNCDVDNDGVNDIVFLNDHSCSFNTDGDPSMEVVFNSSGMHCHTPVEVDGDGDGTPECYLGDYGGETYFDPDQDFDSELGITDNGVRVGGSLTVDLNGATFGENASVGPSGLLYKTDGTSANSSFKVDGTQAAINVDQDATNELRVTSNKVEMYAETDSWADPAISFPSFQVKSGQYLVDANQDGTNELSIADDGGSQTTEITGDFKVNNFGSGDPQFQVAAGSAIFQGTTINLDADGDGAVTTSFGQDDNYIGGNLRIDADNDNVVDVQFTHDESYIKGNLSIDTDHNGVSDVRIDRVAGTTTVTIHGDLNVDGTKNFVQPYPNDPRREIAYVALESGEAGTYTRGSAELHLGTALIDLPEHFGLVTNADGLTAQVTPRGAVHGMLYVESVTPSRLIVRASNPDDQDVRFDYLINGVRRGYEDYQVIRPAHALASSGS